MHRLVERSGPRSGVFDLSVSVLHDAEGLPAASVTMSELVGLWPATGYSPWGLPELRRSVAEHSTWWGLRTTEDQVIITTGAQQAISAAATFAQHATRYGVAVVPPAALSLSPAHAHHLRLSFASPPDLLEEAVARLG